MFKPKRIDIMSSPAGRKLSSQAFMEQFKCCICLDIYTDPVSIPCAHNFCLSCIQKYWDTKVKAECPLCKKTFRKRPVLRINHDFNEILKALKRASHEETTKEAPVGSHSPKVPSRVIDADVIPCDICRGLKSDAVRSCFVCQESYCQTHLSLHQTSPVKQQHQLTDPATFVSSRHCRHHNRQVTLFCKTDQRPVCVNCIEGHHKRHEVIPLEKESKRIKSRIKSTKINLKQMIHNRMRKMDEIRKSVDQSKKTQAWEAQRHGEVCTVLIKTIQGHYSEVVKELDEKQSDAESRADMLLEELEQEIRDLQIRGSELQQLELTENPIHLLQGFTALSLLPPTKEWSEVSVQSDNTMTTMRKAIDTLADACQEITYRVSLEEANKMSKYEVDVTLDPETASGWLMLSADGKQVSVSSHKRKASLPENPLRFDTCVCVLGKQGFTSGRHYWVVQVGDKTDWDLGVVRKSINRKGAISVNPDSGFWAICRRKGGTSLSACARPAISLPLQQTPQKVGIFLDYEEGSVSFYDAEAKSHIYTYDKCDFTEPLCPYFNPCVPENGKNSEPLVICPLSGGQQEFTINT